MFLDWTNLYKLVFFSNFCDALDKNVHKRLIPYTVNRDQRQFPFRFVLWQYHIRFFMFYVSYTTMCTRAFGKHLCNRSSLATCYTSTPFMQHIQDTHSVVISVHCRHTWFAAIFIFHEHDIKAAAVAVTVLANRLPSSRIQQQVQIPHSDRKNQLLCTHVVSLIYVIGQNNCLQLCLRHR